MSIQPCKEAGLWTCRQVVHPSCGEEVATGQPQVHTFLPGITEDYLAHQALPTSRELALLFVDIADSTRLLLQHSPTHALAVVQHFSALVTDIALAHCGDVKDYEGDGALLYFGSLAQAARAALAIRDALLAEQQAGGRTIAVRLSLNVGEVVIGVIGSVQRRAVTFLGPSVHLAARLLKEVAPGGIIAPQHAVMRLQHEAPEIAHHFQLWGHCMVVRGFEEECVTAYHIPLHGGVRAYARSANAPSPSSATLPLRPHLPAS